MRESFQENLLRCILNQAALTKESLRHVEHARAVAPHYFSERRLVFRASLARQLEVGRVFVTVRQKRSSCELRPAGPLQDPPVRGETLLVITPFTSAMAFAFASLELRFALFQLGLLLSCQNGQHLLMKLKFLAHQLGLQACHFR